MHPFITRAGFAQRNLYKANSPVWFRAIDKNNIEGGGKFFLMLTGKDLIEINNQVIPFDSTLTIGNSIYRVIPNPEYNRNLNGKNYYVVFNSVAGAAGAVGGGVNISTISNVSTVLELKMETPAPEKGIDVLNKMFEVYNEEAIKDKNQISQRTLSFIEDRLNLVVGQLDSVEKNIETYKKNQGVYDLSSQASLYFDNVNRELDKRSSEVELQLDVLKDVKNYIESKGEKTRHSTLANAD